MDTTPRCGRDQRGQSLVWVAGMILLVGTLCVLAGRLGVAARTSARAEAVADLAALAGAVGGEPAAAEVAAANGATLVRFTEGDPVETVVELSGSRGAAKARAVTGDGTGGP